MVPLRNHPHHLKLTNLGAHISLLGCEFPNQDDLGAPPSPGLCFSG